MAWPDSSRQTIVLLEQERYVPSLTLAMRIARVFGESVEGVFQPAWKAFRRPAALIDQPPAFDPVHCDPVPDTPCEVSYCHSASRGAKFAPRDPSVFSAEGGIGVARDHMDEAPQQDALLRNEVAELRLRTAMELHDGILQTLTGAKLQIAVARKLVRTDPAAAEEVLDNLGNSVAAEQQELRLYVDELKGRAPAWTDGTLGLSDRIEALLDRVGAIWGLTATADTRVTDPIGGELGRQVLRIIQEGTVNAARHSGAQTVSVSVARDGPHLTISVADDGEGFSFLGEYDNDALKAHRLGPVSLKHRVEETGGRISISSTTRGSTVFVRIPVPVAERVE